MESEIYLDNNTENVYGAKILRQSELGGASNQNIWQSQIRLKIPICRNVDGDARKVTAADLTLFIPDTWQVNIPRTFGEKSMLQKINPPTVFQILFPRLLHCNCYIPNEG